MDSWLQSRGDSLLRVLPFLLLELELNRSGGCCRLLMGWNFFFIILNTSLFFFFLFLTFPSLGKGQDVRECVAQKCSFVSLDTHSPPSLYCKDVCCSMSVGGLVYSHFSQLFFFFLPLFFNSHHARTSETVTILCIVNGFLKCQN